MTLDFDVDLKLPPEDLAKAEISCLMEENDWTEEQAVKALNLVHKMVEDYGDIPVEIMSKAIAVLISTRVLRGDFKGPDFGYLIDLLSKGTSVALELWERKDK